MSRQTRHINQNARKKALRFSLLRFSHFLDLFFGFCSVLKYPIFGFDICCGFWVSPFLAFIFLVFWLFAFVVSHLGQVTSWFASLDDHGTLERENGIDITAKTLWFRCVLHGSGKCFDLQIRIIFSILRC